MPARARRTGGGTCDGMNSSHTAHPGTGQGAMPRHRGPRALPQGPQRTPLAPFPVHLAALAHLPVSSPHVEPRRGGWEALEYVAAGGAEAAKGECGGSGCVTQDACDGAKPQCPRGPSGTPLPSVIESTLRRWHGRAPYDPAGPSCRFCWLNGHPSVRCPHGQAELELSQMLRRRHARSNLHS